MSTTFLMLRPVVRAPSHLCLLTHGLGDYLALIKLPDALPQVHYVAFDFRVCHTGTISDAFLAMGSQELYD